MPFTSHQREQLADYKAQIEMTSYKWGLGIPAFMLILSFIPSGLIPHRNASRVSDPSASLIDLIGFPYVLLGVLAIAALLLLYFFTSYRYFKIRKDLEEEEVLTFQTRVRDVVHKRDADLPEIEVKISPPFQGKHSIEFIDFLNFPPLMRGQTVEITATKHAHYPFSIIPQAPPATKGQNKQADDIQAALDMLKKLKGDQPGS
ncbi:MAG: hypothetical protein AAF206_27725 [Bacteroidota bacterium]